jgi:hypothetical protein
MNLLVIINEKEHGDLVQWMHDHICADDWPLMTEDAEQWLCTLKPGIHEVPDKYVEAIDFAIEDWCELLAAHDEEEEEWRTTLIRSEETA